jgi:hypothetical protein
MKKEGGVSGISGLTTQHGPRLKQGTSAAKNTVAGRTQYKSY